MLGGLGPESTSKFFMMVVRKFHEHKDGHPPLIIFSLPIPFSVEKDLVKESTNADAILPFLIEGAMLLEKAGADFIVIPCNTVHIFIDKIRQSVNIPVLSIIEETAKCVRNKNLSKVGLLATQKSIESNLHKKVFDRFGIEIITQDREDCSDVTNAIFDILSGNANDKTRRLLLKTAEGLIKKGSEAIVLGCTDLMLVVKQEDVNIETMDTLDILADATVREILRMR